MEIKYLGHSCFFITSKDGLRIVTDPYSKVIKYNLPEIEADIIIQSHSHYDHNAVSRIMGAPKVVSGTQKHNVEYELNFPEINQTITFKGILSYHDVSAGKNKGTSTIFLWTLDNIRFCFLGDIGCLPDENIIRQIGKVDVLFIPVGGVSTINSSEASMLINRLTPLAVFPMHYNTPVIDNLKIADESLDDFLSKVNSKKIIDSSVFAFDAITLPINTTVFAFENQKTEDRSQKTDTDEI